MNPTPCGQPVKSRPPWPLPKLLAKNRNALTVYGVLRWLANDRRQLNTTRARITAVCGLHEDTISAAVAALGDAGWVSVGYGRQGNRTWYRLTFPVAGFFPVAGKTRHREGSGGQKNRPQGTARCGRKNRPPVRKYRGASPPPPAAPAASPPPGEEKAYIYGDDPPPADGPTLAEMIAAGVAARKGGRP